MEEKQPAVTPIAASSHRNASVRSRALGSIPATLAALNSTQTDVRRTALAEAAHGFADGGTPRPQESGWVNVLARTFFSYSADEYSPSRLAWEAVIRGLSVIGSLDQDNLGALEEMYAAGDALGIRTTVSVETRASAQTYADREVNRPGEPGVVDIIGAGFVAVPATGTAHGDLIAMLPDRARETNLAIVDKANQMLAPVSLSYQDDVLPSTPAGNATVRHIAAAYVRKSAELFPELHDRAVFWADVIGRAPADAECLLGELPTLQDMLSDRLAGMVGRDLPGRAGVHPAVSDFCRAVRASGAVPCLPWLDGKSAAEREVGKLLDDAMLWGVRAVAVLPDRAWNVVDASEKAARLSALEQLVSAARERGLPVLAGSKMDGPKQKFMDSLDAPEIAAYFRDFTDSAFWLYGHTVMQRAVGNGVCGEWAKRHFGRDFKAANAFYLEVGKKARPEAGERGRIAEVGDDATPGEVLNAL